METKKIYSLDIEGNEVELTVAADATVFVSGIPSEQTWELSTSSESGSTEINTFIGERSTREERN